MSVTSLTTYVINIFCTQNFVQDLVHSNKFFCSVRLAVLSSAFFAQNISLLRNSSFFRSIAKLSFLIDHFRYIAIY